MMSRVILLTLLALLSACASYMPPRQQPAPVETSEPDTVDTPSVMVGPPAPADGRSTDRPAVPPPSPLPSSESPPPVTASSTLLASVDAAIAAGDLERAAAVSERALRISPRDAAIWYRLASIRYQQGNYTDARGLATRAHSYAGNDAGLRRQINDLLQRLNDM